MNRIIALAWGGAALFIGGSAVSIALGPKGDASGWVMAPVFALAAALCAWSMWREWNEEPPEGAVLPGAGRAPTSPSPIDFAGAWRGPGIPLETQIEALREAGLVLATGRTIEEMLTSWPRADYEADPYNLLLFMYGSEVEAEPWGRWFCERGWNFDMECLEGAGDYVRAFTQILRITGQPQLAKGMSDDFDIAAETAAIRYTMNGRQQVLQARVENDWADPKAVAVFVHDIETTIGDGRRFWAADNGQASVLFFLTDAEAGRINALRRGILQKYIGA